MVRRNNENRTSPHTHTYTHQKIWAWLVYSILSCYRDLENRNLQLWNALECYTKKNTQNKGPWNHITALGYSSDQTIETCPERGGCAMDVGGLRF